MNNKETTFLLGGDLPVRRMGYGAMRLCGPGVWGEPADRGNAVKVLREAVDLGVNHIDTSDFYGPHVVNEIIHEALYPYPDDLVIVTKVGARRGADKSWPSALSAAELEQAVHDNLRRLKLDCLDLVNLRIVNDADPHRPGGVPIEAPLTALIRLREKGLIRHLGLSHVTLDMVEQAMALTPIACVQNHYGILHREDDALVALCARHDMGFVPFFPLGGGIHPHSSRELESCAAEMGISVHQLSLAWLLQFSRCILPIPGTASLGHLRENMDAARITLPDGIMNRLNNLVQS